MTPIKHSLLVAAALALVTACYQPNALECAVSCAGTAACPGGLICGADQLCHGGNTECSAQDASVADAPDDDASMIDASTDFSFCGGGQLGLIGCYEFENNSNDGTRGRQDLTTVELAYAAGKVGQGGLFKSGTSAQVPSARDSAFDVANFTLELWIRQLTVVGDDTSLINHDFEYALTLDSSNTLRCYYYTGTAGVVDVAAPSRLPAGAWTHLACTYDGATLALYIDGNKVATRSDTRPVMMVPVTEVRIGSDPSLGRYLVGAVDQVRIFRRARSPQQICEAAGKSSCS